MKGLEKISMLVNVASTMIKEKKESGVSNKEEIKKDVDNIINSKIVKKLFKDVVSYNKVKLNLIKEILGSEEAEFIKTAIKESDQGKKVINAVDTVEDLVPLNVKIEYINYKHWLLNWYYIAKMGLSAPIPVLGGLLKYNWVFDLLKCNSMANAYCNKRNGANVEQVQSELTFIVKDICDRLQFAFKHPDELVIIQNMVPPEIVTAMGLHCIFPELQSGILPKADQFCGIRYLDAAESKGLPSDTCGMPRFTAGLALLNELTPGKCMITSNLPCDGGLASYEVIQERLGNIPTYRLNVPYNFRNDESQETFVEDLKGLIKFLEENTNRKMDWNNMREVCNNYNEMVEAELERWEMAKSDNTPITSDGMWLPHLWNFNVTSGSKESTDQQKKLLKLSQKAYKKGIPAFKGIKYRAISWNPPPTGYAHWWNWIERCWGVGTVMDLETCGIMQPIDTSTPDTMLKGLGRRYMWGTMAKHTRGPAKNMIEDLETAIEEYRADFVIYPAHIGCKNSMSMETEMREACRRHNIPLCVFKFELLDSRVASRQEIRNQISKFMTDVMHEEPVDPSLLYIDDTGEDKW